MKNIDVIYDFSCVLEDSKKHICWFYVSFFKDNINKTTKEIETTEEIRLHVNVDRTETISLTQLEENAVKKAKEILIDLYKNIL